MSYSFNKCATKIYAHKPDSTLKEHRTLKEIKIAPTPTYWKILLLWFLVLIFVLCLSFKLEPPHWLLINWFFTDSLWQLILNCQDNFFYTSVRQEELSNLQPCVSKFVSDVKDILNSCGIYGTYNIMKLKTICFLYLFSLFLFCIIKTTLRLLNSSYPNKEFFISNAIFLFKKYWVKYFGDFHKVLYLLKVLNKMEYYSHMFK